MSDEKDSPGHPEEPTATGAEASVPMQMQLFSTWEVRKVPANCVSRFVQRKGGTVTQKGGLGLVLTRSGMFRWQVVYVDGDATGGGALYRGGAGVGGSGRLYEDSSPVPPL